jgi:competence protein ComEC
MFLPDPSMGLKNRLELGPLDSVEERVKLTNALPRQPFLGLTLAAAVGIVLADLLPVPRLHWIVFGGLLALAAGVAFLRPRLWATYAFIGVGFFALHTLQTRDTPGVRLAAKLGEHPRTIRVRGWVVSEPKIAPNKFATFMFRLKSIEFEGRTLPATARILVRWRGAPQMGDEFEFFGTAERIEPPRNPGEFDMRSYLARRDIYRSLFVRYAEGGTLVRRGAGNVVLRAASKSRDWMQAVLCRNLDDSPDVQNFISGIALGIRHQTPQDIEEPFQQTGTLHLFAVAGLHVGIVARLLWIVAMVVRLSRKWAVLFIVPLLLFYAAVTGLHVSSVRAAVMSSVFLGAFVFERRAFTLNSLAAAAFVLLAWNTNELFATGFQLSFAVVGAIVLVADPLFRISRQCAAPDAFLPRRLLSLPRRWFGRGFELVCRGGSVSLAAWLGSLLLVIWYFHLVTPISLLANLVVVPIAFFILAIALLSIATAPLFATASIVFNNANWCLARLVLALVHGFAQLPGGHYYVARPHWPDGARTRITVLDAGAGAAVHVRTRGANWLFDCGGRRDYQRLLLAYLHTAGVNGIDGLLLSHGDSLHIGGAELLLQDFRPGTLIDNPASDHSFVHRRLHALFAARKIVPLNLCAGREFKVGEDIRAKILFPPRDIDASQADDKALVVQLSIGRAGKVLFLSDSGYATENALLGAGADLRSDILVKGQHRSGQSGSEAFLDAVRPRLIVATSREFPQSERIAEEWAKRVRDRGIKLFRQDETGAVELRFGEQDWQARSYVTGETFRSASR